MPRKGKPKSHKGQKEGLGSGGSGSFRKYNLSKSLRRRSAKNKARRPKDFNDPELMDLDAPDKATVNASPRVSMNTLSKRPNRRMLDEVRYTNSHVETTMSRSLRDRPVEFVKARVLYDPSKDLIALLSRKSQQLEPSETVAGPLSETGPAETQVAEETETMAEPSQEIEPEETIFEDKTAEEDQEDGAGFRYIDCSRKNTYKSEKQGNLPSEDKASAVDSTQISDEALFSAPISETASSAASENDDAMDEALNDDSDHDSDQDSDHESFSSPFNSGDEVSFSIDDSGDTSALHTVAKPSTLAVLRNKPKPAVVWPVDTNAPPLEHEPYLAVGKVMMRTQTDQHGNLVATIRQSNQKRNLAQLFDDINIYSSDDDDAKAAYEDYKAQLLAAQDNDENSEDDSEFDEDDSDIEDVEGVRFDEYFKDTTNFENFESLTDFEDSQDEDDVNLEEEGLEEILAFARVQKSASPLDFPTQTHKTKGKGRKERLVLGLELELELRESLMEQFQYQKQLKRDKKLRKKAKVKQEALDQNVLREKYEYSLHIKEIKDEFESLLHDTARESVSFPPLDGHGNKTVSKLAGHYNMKCVRCGGNGLALYMRVIKTRKTFRYVPAYDQIAYIMKQRPVFKRSDVKRTREEIAETDGKKNKKDKEKNNAFVREGDIVGGAAPEIAHNNIGRQLLEKLGWVRGEGLGALGNKGISEPLTATVKKSKTGLR